jgi:hypothetical protein
MVSLILLSTVTLALVIYFTARHVRTQSTAIVSDSVNRPFYFHVFGINQKNQNGTSRQDIINGCHKGEELVLDPDPDNRQRSGIVKVCRKNGEQIGSLSTDSGGMVRDFDVRTFRTTIDQIYPFDENPQKHGVLLRLEVLATMGSPDREASLHEAGRRKQLE